MEWTYIFIVAVILVSILHELLSSRKKQKTKSKKYKYTAKKDIMTNAEKKFYKKLQIVCGDDILIFPQVHLSTLFNHKIKGQNWRGAFNSINQKSVDYILCRKDNLKPIIAIELDDYTHNKVDRIRRDENVESIFRDSGLSLLRCSDLNISNSDLKSIILKSISK